VPIEEHLHLLQSRFGLGGVRHLGADLENMRHALIQVQHRNAAGCVDRSVVTDKVTQEDFLGSALDQGARKSL